jgi:hypothetical protein
MAFPELNEPNTKHRATRTKVRRTVAKAINMFDTPKPKGEFRKSIEQDGGRTQRLSKNERQAGKKIR